MEEIQRLAIETGPLNVLPYADRLVDMVVATTVNSELLPQLSVKEILRVLRPEIVCRQRLGGHHNSRRRVH